MVVRNRVILASCAELLGSLSIDKTSSSPFTSNSLKWWTESSVSGGSGDVWHRQMGKMELPAQFSAVHRRTCPQHCALFLCSSCCSGGGGIFWSCRFWLSTSGTGARSSYSTKNGVKRLLIYLERCSVKKLTNWETRKQ